MSRLIGTRYVGPCNTYVYWDFFPMDDGGTSWYNDWRVVDIIPKRKRYREEDDHQVRKVVTIWGIEWTMANQVVVLRWLWCLLSGERPSVRLLSCEVDKPSVHRNKSKVIIKGKGEFNVQKGDWVCEGRWLETVPGRCQNWWCETAQECIVRMQMVADADVNLLQISEDNQLPHHMLVKDKYFSRNNAIMVVDDSHNLLIEESLQREAFNHAEYFGGPKGSDNEMESDDEYEHKNTEYE